MAIGKTTPAAIALIVALLAACCDKETGPSPAAPPVNDRFDVLLKTLDVQPTASPFYHFTYDDSGYVTRLSYHEDLYVYHYYYKGRRIDSVAGSSNDAKYFLYRYTDTRVSSVQQYDALGLKLTLFIQYDGRGRVVKMDWQPATPGPDEKHTVLTYYENGNLKHIENTYPATGQSTIADFEAYDNKRCADGFAVYREALEHVVLLPQVRFMYNNPTRVQQRNGDHVRISHINYTYRDSVPLERHSITEVTEGPMAGDRYTSFSLFTYY